MSELNVDGDAFRKRLQTAVEHMQIEIKHVESSLAQPSLAVDDLLRAAKVLGRLEESFLGDVNATYDCVG